MAACAAGWLEAVPTNKGKIQKKEGGNGLFIQSRLSIGNNSDSHSCCLVFPRVFPNSGFRLKSPNKTR